MNRPTYLAIYPIGDTRPLAMPVKDMARAARWYEERMGFTVVALDPQTKAAVLKRDQIQIGLAENGDDPEQASCYIQVSDVDAAHAQLSASQVNVSDIRIDTHGGTRRRIFFAKDEDGICYCLGAKVED